MRSLARRIAGVHFPPFTFPLALLGLCVLSYGLLLPWLGFYWDDWAFTWIGKQLGTAGLARYFSTNRPFWGLLYRLSTSVLGSVPWRWQLFGLFWRWVNALSLWWLLRLALPKQARIAVWAAILFVVYPGFDQQPIAITYGHFWVVLTAFFLSLSFSLLALRSPRRRLVYTLLALALSLVNLLTMEYFFLLELLRPLVFWLAVDDHSLAVRPRLRRVALHWLPYLALFLAAAAWRAFFFPYQTQNYTPAFLDALRARPAQALFQLLTTVLVDLWRVSAAAWAQAFRLPDVAVFGARTTLLYGLLTAAVILLAGAYLLRLKTGQQSPGGWRRAVVLALAALALAGGPFWLTGLEIGLTYPNSRFTVPFMLGSCLLLAALLEGLPLRAWIKATALALLVGFAVGYQFQVANDYRRDWNLQKTLFWQMAWRMPALEPGTTLLSNDLPPRHVSDNSLTAPLNLIYAPENRSSEMSFMLYYPTVRLERGLLSLESGLPIRQNYLAAWFDGSTSQVVSLVFSPPGCLRVLDPDLDPLNAMLPPLLRSAAALSGSRWISPADPPQAARPPVEIFGPEPPRSWCYSYAKAALAAQQGDWQQVAALGDEAFSLGDYPNDPMERIPFIEGYAYSANWERAQELTGEAGRITALMQPVLCRLWQRIADQAPPGPEKDAALQAVRAELSCRY